MSLRLAFPLPFVLVIMLGVMLGLVLSGCGAEPTRFSRAMDVCSDTTHPSEPVLVACDYLLMHADAHGDPLLRRNPVVRERHVAVLMQLADSVLELDSLAAAELVFSEHALPPPSVAEHLIW